MYREKLSLTRGPARGGGVKIQGLDCTEPSWLMCKHHLRMSNVGPIGIKFTQANESTFYHTISLFVVAQEYDRFINVI